MKETQKALEIYLNIIRSLAKDHSLPEDHFIVSLFKFGEYIRARLADDSLEKVLNAIMHQAPLINDPDTLAKIQQYKNLRKELFQKLAAACMEKPVVPEEKDVLLLILKNVITNANTLLEALDKDKSYLFSGFNRALYTYVQECQLFFGNFYIFRKHNVREQNLIRFCTSVELDNPQEVLRRLEQSNTSFYYFIFVSDEDRNVVAISLKSQYPDALQNAGHVADNQLVKLREQFRFLIKNDQDVKIWIEATTKVLKAFQGFLNGGITKYCNPVFDWEANKQIKAESTSVLNKISNILNVLDQLRTKAIILLPDNEPRCFEHFCHRYLIEEIVALHDDLMKTYNYVDRISHPLKTTFEQAFGANFSTSGPVLRSRTIQEAVRQKIDNVFSDPYQKGADVQSYLSSKR